MPGLHLCFAMLSLMAEPVGTGPHGSCSSQRPALPVWLLDTSLESLGPKQPSYWGLGTSSGACVATRTETLSQRKAAGPQAPKTSLDTSCYTRALSIRQRSESPTR